MDYKVQKQLHQTSIKYLYDSNGYPCYYMSITLLNVESIVIIYFSTGTF